MNICILKKVFYENTLSVLKRGENLAIGYVPIKEVIHV
jgi:hypothetical protein